MIFKGTSKGPDREFYLTNAGKLWIPAGRGLFKPSWGDLLKLSWLKMFGIEVVTEMPAIAGGSGFSGGGGGGGTNNFVITFNSNAAGAAMAQNQTYALGVDNVLNSAGAVNTRYSKLVPVASTLKAAYWGIDIRTTDGTDAQNVTHVIRLNDTTDTSGVAFDYFGTGTPPTYKTGSETGLSVEYAAGDRVDAKLTTPAVWTTPASGVRGGCGALFVVP